MKYVIFFSIFIPRLVFGVTAKEVGLANLDVKRTGTVLGGGECELLVTFKKELLIDHVSLAPDGYYISSESLSVQADGKVENNALVISWPFDVFVFHFDPKSLKFKRFQWQNENIDCRLF